MFGIGAPELLISLVLIVAVIFFLIARRGGDRPESGAARRGGALPADDSAEVGTWPPDDPSGYAGFWRRVVAWFLDMIFITSIGWMIGLVLGIVIPLVGFILAFFVGLFIPWLYYAFMESSSRQATLGKSALGIIVTDSAGDRLSFGRATGRYFAKILSGFTLSIGYIMAGFTQRRQALHDMLSSCLVVKVPARGWSRSGAHERGESRAPLVGQSSRPGRSEGDGLVCSGCGKSYSTSVRWKTCDSCGSPLVRRAEHPSPAGTARVESASAALETPEIRAKRQIFDAKLSKDPLNTQTLEEFGDFLAASAIPNEALVQYLKAVETNPERAELRLKLAGVYEKLEQWDEAAVQLRLVLEEQPHDERVTARLVDLLVRGGRPAEATRLLDQELQKNPNSARLLRARLGMMKGGGEENLEQRATLLRQVVSADPKDADGWHTLGETAAALGNRNEAKEAFQRCLEVRPDDAGAALGLAEQLVESGSDRSRAEALLRAVLLSKQASPAMVAIARGRMIELLLRTGTDAAAEPLAIAADMVTEPLHGDRRPWAGGVLLGLGNALIAKGRTEDAQSVLERSRRLYDSTPVREALSKIHATEAKEHMAARRFGAARAGFERALELTPDDSDSMSGRKRAAAAQRRGPLMIAAGVVVVALAVAGYLYFRVGSLEVRGPQDGVVTVLNSVGSEFMWDEVEGTTYRTRLSPGQYRIRVTGARLVNWDSVVTVHGGRTTSLVGPRKAGFGRWVVRSSPKAELQVDGQTLGTTPLELPKLPMGPHEVSLIAGGYQPWTSTERVEHGEDRTLNITLRRDPSYISLAQAQRLIEDYYLRNWQRQGFRITRIANIRMEDAGPGRKRVHAAYDYGTQANRRLGTDRRVFTLVRGLEGWRVEGMGSAGSGSISAESHGEGTDGLAESAVHSGTADTRIAQQEAGERARYDWTFQEVTVSARSAQGAVSRPLAPGIRYEIEVSGTYDAWGRTPHNVDAVACFADPQCTAARRSKLAQGFRINGQGLIDLSNGMLSFNSDHVYTVTMTGSGQPLTFWINDARSSGGDNAGALTVRLKRMN